MQSDNGKAANILLKLLLGKRTDHHQSPAHKITVCTFEVTT